MTLSGIAVGLVALASSISGQSTSSAVSTAPIVFAPDRTAMAAARFVDHTRRESVAEYVQEYFAETPLLVEIAFCESTYRHVGLDGSTLRGNVDSGDIGIMQINERYHGKKAQELGFDIYTLEGNLAYAKYLYEREGAKPWKSSSKCWMKSEAYKNPSEA